MVFQKLENFSKKVSDLSDSPSQNMTPAEIKSVFDTPPEELRVAHNSLVDELNVTDKWTQSTGEHRGSWQGLTPQMIGAPEMNSARITATETQLFQIATNIKSKGAKGDGVDDTEAFKNACSFAIANKTSLYLPSGTYVVNLTSHIDVPTIIGQNATIIVNGNYSFKFGSDFLLSGVRILTNNYNLLADINLTPIFAQQSSGQKNVMIDNVEFVANLDVLDGKKRAAYCMSIAGVDGVKFHNVTAKGFLTAFQVTGASKNIKGENIVFENTQTGFYLSGSKPSSVTDMTYIKEIQFTNVSHTNTKTQSQNYTTIVGADTFMMEKCENVILSIIKGEYVIERSVYANCVNNLVTTNFNLFNCYGAVKVVGVHRSDITLNNHAINAFISNINMRNTDIESSMFSFYFAERIRVTGCNFEGNGLGDVFIEIENHVEKLRVDNNSVDGLKRSFLFYWNQGTRVDNPEGNFPAYMYDVTVQDNYCRNICSVDYNFIRTQDDGTILTSGYNGTRRYKTINILNNTIINSETIISGSTAHNCKGIIDLKDVEGLKVKDNMIQGWKGKNDVAGRQIAFPVQVGANSYSVIVQHKEVLPSYFINKKFPMGSLNVSAGSKIEFVIYDRLVNLSDSGVVLPHVSNVDPETVQDLNTKYTINGHIEKTQEADDSTYIMGYNAGTTVIPNLVGGIEVNTAAGEWGKFSLTSSGTSIKNAGSNAIYDTAFTAGKIGVYKNASNPQYYLVKNKSGVAGRVVIDYNLTTV